MPTKRHEELRSFGHRLLAYMGITDIRDEKTIDINLVNGKRKQYRIDIIGYKPFSKITPEVDRVILVEMGNNDYEKINNLRLAGYFVMVIPYSENEEEWQDEKKLLELMVKSHEDLQERFIKLICTWREVGESKLEEIESKNPYKEFMENQRKLMDKYKEIDEKLFLFYKFIQGFRTYKFNERIEDFERRIENE